MTNKKNRLEGKRVSFKKYGLDMPITQNFSSASNVNMNGYIKAVGESDNGVYYTIQTYNTNKEEIVFALASDCAFIE
jgi:hypothetical protein